MRKLLTGPRAVAGLTLDRIDEDTRLFELAGGELHLRLVEPAQAGRLKTQAFIARAYRRVFDAQLHSFYPSLIALHGANNALAGAAGARYADGQTLFLEQYLPRPVEYMISRAAGTEVKRDSIVELGNLSVGRPALTYPFIGMIGGWLQTYRVEWIVFALTQSLRRLFRRAGVDMLDLGAAEPSLLGPSPNVWGRYYEHDPRVMAARLAPGINQFQLHHGSLAGRAVTPLCEEASACH